MNILRWDSTRSVASSKSATQKPLRGRWLSKLGWCPGLDGKENTRYRADSGGGCPSLFHAFNKVVYTQSRCELCFEQEGSTLNPIYDFNHPLYERIEYKTERRKVIGRNTVLTANSLAFSAISRACFSLTARCFWHACACWKSNILRFHSQNLDGKSWKGS